MLRVLCVIRLPNDIRRAFRLTVLDDLDALSINKAGEKVDQLRLNRAVQVAIRFVEENGGRSTPSDDRRKLRDLMQSGAA
jgi:hypothetical protein